MDVVFNQARIGVEAGDITELCFDRFSALYCHQAFSMCRKELFVPIGDGSEGSMSHYVSVNSSLCADDCESVIGGDCSEQHWDYLTNIVDQFRSIGSIQLPTLQQRSDCNSSLAHTSSGNCTSLNTGLLQPSVIFHFLCRNDFLIKIASKRDSHAARTNIEFSYVLCTAICFVF